MPTPSTRTPVRIARGSYSNLNGSVSDLQDGEISYAEDQNKLYIKEGSSLVSLTFAPSSPTFTGDVTFTGAANNVVFDASDNALEFADNAKATFGSSAELQIHHDSTNSWIYNYSGNLTLGVNSEVAVKMIPDGAVELYYDNVKRGETNASGWHVTGLLTSTGNFQINNDTSQIRLGASQDLRIYHNGNASYIEDVGTGNLIIRASSNVSIQSYNGNEDIAKFIENGSVELYHNNVKKFETQASGIDVTGTIGCDKIVIDGPYQQVAEALGALDINCGNGNYFTKTISANSTFTFSNAPSSGTSFAFTLELTHSSGTVTWPSSVKWNADTAPTLTAGKTHLFMFVTDDGGSRYRGSALVDYVN